MPHAPSCLPPVPFVWPSSLAPSISLKSAFLFLSFFLSPRNDLSLVGFEPDVIRSCQIADDSVISVAIRRERNGMAVTANERRHDTTGHWPTSSFFVPFFFSFIPVRCGSHTARTRALLPFQTSSRPSTKFLCLLRGGSNPSASATAAHPSIHLHPSPLRVLTLNLSRAQQQANV